MSGNSPEKDTRRKEPRVRSSPDVPFPSNMVKRGPGFPFHPEFRLVDTSQSRHSPCKCKEGRPDEPSGISRSIDPLAAKRGNKGGESRPRASLLVVSYPLPLSPLMPSAALPPSFTPKWLASWLAGWLAGLVGLSRLSYLCAFCCSCLQTCRTKNKQKGRETCKPNHTRVEKWREGGGSGRASAATSE